MFLKWFWKTFSLGLWKLASLVNSICFWSILVFQINRKSHLSLLWPSYYSSGRHENILPEQYQKIGLFWLSEGFICESCLRMSGTGQTKTWRDMKKADANYNSLDDSISFNSLNKTFHSFGPKEKEYFPWHKERC